MMTSKERVQAAFAFRQPDFTPLDYYATPEIHSALLRHFGATSDNQIREALGVDVRFVNPVYIGPALPTFADGSRMDFWGIIKKPMANEYGDYLESVNWPYAGWNTLDDAAGFSWPSPDWFDYTTIAGQCRAYPDKAIFTGQFSVQDFINGVAFGRGVEQVLVDIALEDPVYLFILEKRHRFYMEYIERILQAGNGAIDAVLCGDDFGTQRGLLISPASFDAIFAPRKQEFFAMVHSYGARVTHHCCGSSRALIPRFITLGMDALQTIQPQAAGMDPFELKQAYHGQLVLHGAVDVQGWLQKSTVPVIKSRIRELSAIVGQGGGYIMSPSHHIQPDTPLENVLAFYAAATEGR
jgi:uroporphyrinogen decarboxylase